MKAFEPINKGYNNVFKPDQLSIGLVVPIENYDQGPVPTMKQHLEKVKKIDKLGFKALWLRDIPFNVPSFGDAGQTFDPFTYLGYLAGQTEEIALGVSSIALPLHHPVHVAKAATSVDQLSDGRLILGVASGDRFDEYPAMGIEYDKRGELFREAFSYLRKAQEDFPRENFSHYGNLSGFIDVLPKPVAHKIPLLITGNSRQTLDWNATNGDGWMSYPKNIYQQNYTIAQWRELVEKNQAFDKPFMQPLYIVLQEDASSKPEAIPLGFKIGINHLIDYLHQLREIGVNHVALNLRFNNMDMDRTLELLSSKLLPYFHLNQTEEIPT